ncbi:uncharacterized protein LOC121902364 isoform X3 [Scomber scombrus]|uniref:Uncharacterized protein LOC121902364 isoform X3 n=1 Tax=Scomber scombrus TaxID=13677 RepID=A0AAV1PJ34_SCOSC
MWCYQKPGFEALLLAELQRQQQCSQFCDTLLKAEGVSVPAHGCILSAISPHFSSALSSTPAPPAGKSRLLEFRAFGTCTLLHMVRLLYSGEMAGEGEEEKQEAISAAAKLGIHGLVEVTKTVHKSRNREGDCRHIEVGVQTEPLIFEEREARQSRWRREVRDGSTLLWKEMLSNGEKDSWTQTEELQVNTAPSYPPAASFETIDMTDLQSLGQTDSLLVPPQIPYVPISLIYPPHANQTSQPSSASAASFHESPAAVHKSVAVEAPPYSSGPLSLLPFSSQVTPCAADPHNWWAGPQGAGRDVAAGEEWEDERLEQFQGNIPGFISYFLNPDKVEEPCRGRPRRRQGAGDGGARRAGTGERRARRPRARTGGRGQGGLMQTVDVQDVGVSVLQKLFLQRWGIYVCRTGQGGGAVGRKLFLKTREALKKSRPRKRGGGKACDVSQSGELVPNSEMGGGGNTQRGRRTTTQRTGAKSAASVSPSSTARPFYNVHTLPAPSPSMLPSQFPRLMLPAASYAYSASSLFHTTPLPPLAPPLHEDQPEHLDRLLEEVIMDLGCSSSINNFSQNKQPSHTTGLLDAGPGLHEAGRSSSAKGKGVPVLQQKAEGELTEMLDHFLQSFEQHIDSCTARQEEEMTNEGTTETSHPYTALSKYSRTKIQITELHTPHPQRTHTARPAQSRSQPCKASSHSASSPNHTEGTPERVKAKRPRKRKTKQYPFSTESWRVKKSAPLRNTKTKIMHDRENIQLLQMPVVQLERSGLLPVKVTLQGPSDQSLEVKSPEKTNSSLSSVKSARVSFSEEKPLVSWSRMIYPIRSRFKEAHITDTMPFLEQPLGQRRVRPRKNRQPLNLSNDERPKTPIHLQPAELCDRDEKLKRNQERYEEQLTVLPQEEATRQAGRGTKRGAEESSDEASVAKRVCFEQMKRPVSESHETCLPSSESTVSVSESEPVETEDVIDVEAISLTSVEDTLQRKEQVGKTVWSEIKFEKADQNMEWWEHLTDEEMESSGNEVIDVDGDSEGSTELKRGDDCRVWAEKIHRTEQFVKVEPPPSKGVSLGSTGSWEEDRDGDVDVIGGSSPLPDPVIISWTESSGGEDEEGDEEIDITGEKTDYTS